MADKASIRLQRSRVLQIENISTSGNFKREIYMNFCHKPTMRPKMVGHFRLNWKILPSSNGCKLIENGHRFVNLRKYLCFAHFLKQRKFFCSTKTTFIPKQLKNVPKKMVKKRLYLFSLSLKEKLNKGIHFIHAFGL